MANAMKSSHAAKKFISFLILLNVDQDPHNDNRQINEDVCEVLKTDMQTIDWLKQRFVLEGLDEAIGAAPTSRVYETKTDGETEARLVSIACSEPPKGFGKWSFRLLADRIQGNV